MVPRWKFIFASLNPEIVLAFVEYWQGECRDNSEARRCMVPNMNSKMLLFFVLNPAVVFFDIVFCLLVIVYYCYRFRHCILLFGSRPLPTSHGVWLCFLHVSHCQTLFMCWCDLALTRMRQTLILHIDAGVNLYGVVSQAWGNLGAPVVRLCTFSPFINHGVCLHTLQAYFHASCVLSNT